VRIVVDTNVLFSFFKSGSVSCELILKSPFVLIAPKFALKELRKYAELICKKSGIGEDEFKRILKELQVVVDFVGLPVYSSFVDEVKSICPDRKDVDFLALAFCEKSFLWSNDLVLKSQEMVKVYTTREIVELFFS
jgi:predicted nucleic acid-binding protein